MRIVTVIALLGLIAPIADAMGRTSTDSDNSDSRVYRRASPANPNPAFTPPDFVTGRPSAESSSTLSESPSSSKSETQRAPKKEEPDLYEQMQKEAAQKKAASTPTVAVPANAPADEGLSGLKEVDSTSPPAETHKPSGTTTTP